MIRIAVDAQQIASPGRPTGLGVYVDRLLEAFADAAPPDMEFYLLHTAPVWQGRDYGLRFHPVSYRFTSLHSAAVCCNLNSVLKFLHIDLFHAACTNGIPPQCVCPSIATIHDLFPLTHPRGVPFIQRFFFRLLFSFTRGQASLFLCNSRFTRNELLNFSVAPDSASVIYLAPQMSFEARPRITPDSPFYLCVGAIEPRKGQLDLARGYLMALERNPALPDLIFIGPDRGDASALRRLALTSPKLRYLEFLPRRELETYYLSASLFLFPSRLEGLGLPILEAMSAGLPVICSDIPVFHEIADRHAVYAPCSPSGFQQAILDFAAWNTPFDPEPARRHARAFSWHNTALQTLDAYRAVLKK